MNETGGFDWANLNKANEALNKKLEDPEEKRIFEEIQRGEVVDIKKYYEDNQDKIKGEIVVLVY